MSPLPCNARLYCNYDSGHVGVSSNVRVRVSVVSAFMRLSCAVWIGTVVLVSCLSVIVMCCLNWSCHLVFVDAYL